MKKYFRNMKRTLLLTIGLLFNAFFTVAQNANPTLIDQDRIVQKLEEFSEPVIVNPDFVTQYNIKSITLKFEQGEIGLDAPKSRPNQAQYSSLNKLVFNMSGKIVENYFIKEEDKIDTVEALYFEYDNWGKPTVSAFNNEGKRQKQIFTYKDGHLAEINTFDKHGATGSSIKLFRNKSNELDRKEEFVENNLLQTEYFCAVDTPEDILDYLKETEIGNKLADILVIYISDKGRVKKEITHTSFSDYCKRFTYDRKNRIVAISQSDYGRMVTEIFKYDDIGNLKEYIHSSSGLPTTKIVYGYDTNGVFLTTITRLVDGEVKDDAVVSYQFRY